MTLVNLSRGVLPTSRRTCRVRGLGRSGRVVEQPSYPDLDDHLQPPPPFISTLLLVVWWPMWQWMSHLPGFSAFQMTSGNVKPSRFNHSWISRVYSWSAARDGPPGQTTRRES